MSKSKCRMFYFLAGDFLPGDLVGERFSGDCTRGAFGASGWPNDILFLVPDRGEVLQEQFNM